MQTRAEQNNSDTSNPINFEAEDELHNDRSEHKQMAYNSVKLVHMDSHSKVVRVRGREYVRVVGVRIILIGGRQSANPNPSRAGSTILLRLSIFDGFITCLSAWHSTS